MITLTANTATNEDLVRLAKMGDELAKEELFERNQPFIHKMAHKYRNIDNHEDLVSIGNFGLLKAYISYDPDKGIKFISYYSRIVVNEILLHFRRNKKHSKVRSVDEKVYEDGKGNDVTLLDLKSDTLAELPLDKYETNQFVNQVLEHFYQTESGNLVEVMNLRLIKNVKQKETARILGISQAQVSRLENKAKAKLVEFAKTLQ